MARRASTSARNRRAPPARMAVRSGFPGWAWLILGLALGAAGAAVFYISQNRPSSLAPVPPQASPAPAPSSPPAPQGQAAPSDSSAAPPPAVPAPVQNNFDFYKLLKEGEVIIPAPEKGKAPAAPAPAAVPGAPAPGTPAPVPTGGFILQAGSYRNLEDADRVKANLALLGVESRIEKAVLKSGETWYRLRIGPLTDPQQVETVRARLKENGINALLIRMDR